MPVWSFFDVMLTTFAKIPLVNGSCIIMKPFSFALNSISPFRFFGTIWVTLTRVATRFCVKLKKCHPEQFPGDAGQFQDSSGNSFWKALISFHSIAELKFWSFHDMSPGDASFEMHCVSYLLKKRKKVLRDFFFYLKFKTYKEFVIGQLVTVGNVLCWSR
jgi:hypothetical protein